MKRALLVILVAALSGCAQQPSSQSVVDTFCLTAAKRDWDVSDSPESIQKADAYNKAIDRKCSGKKVASS